MITKPLRLWHLLDVNGTRIRPRYIRSAANRWGDGLGQELDRNDSQLNPCNFRYH
jgi:hypothetical protein